MRNAPATSSIAARAVRLTAVRLAKPWIRPGWRRARPGRRPRAAARRRPRPRRAAGRSRRWRRRPGAGRRGRRPAAARRVGRRRRRRRQVVALEPVHVVRGQQEALGVGVARRLAADSVGDRVDQQLIAGCGPPASRPSRLTAAARLPPALSPPTAIRAGSAPSVAGVLGCPGEGGEGVVDRGAGTGARAPGGSRPRARGSRRARRGSGRAPSWVSRSPITQPPPWK